MEKAAKADLRRWKSVALRRLKAGENPGEYDFESESIPADVARQVKAMLDGAGSEEDVAVAFRNAPHRIMPSGGWKSDAMRTLTEAEQCAMVAELREWYGKAQDGTLELKKKSHPAGQP